MFPSARKRVRSSIDLGKEKIETNESDILFYCLSKQSFLLCWRESKLTLAASTIVASLVPAPFAAPRLKTDSTTCDSLYSLG
jgi:hypothetical protein